MQKISFPIIIGLLLLLITSCADKNDNYNKPEQILLEILEQKKVLMLADFKHSTYHPYHSVLKLLNHWVEQFRAKKQYNKNITLVIEYNNEFQKIQEISQKEWKNKYWNKIHDRIKLFNVIGIYWIGYPYEKGIAKKYLIEKTGMNFNAADQYFKWYRDRYYNCYI